jgi:hypothetical protein
MTPEERAKEIANKISFEAGAHHTSWFCATAKEWIATAIREAVAAEREANAKIAEGFDCADARNALPNEAITAALGIAAYIRARKDTP